MREKISNLNKVMTFVSQINKVVTFALFFILLGRYLGPEQFGIYTTILAIVTIFSGFSDLGYGHLIIQSVTKNKKNFNVYYGNGLFILLINILLLIIFLTVFNNIAFGFPTNIVLMVIIADLLFFKIIDLNSKSFQAFGNLAVMSLFIISIGIVKVASVFIIILITSFKPSLEEFLTLYILLYGVVTLLTTIYTIKTIGVPRLKIRDIRFNVKQGIHFSIGGMSRTIYIDVDKIMLTKFISADVTGMYSVAYKIMSLAFFPIQSLLLIYYRSFFEAGKSHINNAVKLSKKLGKLTVVYAVGASILVYFCAPLITLFMGSQYEESITMVRLLLLMLIIQSLYYPFADAMTGSGHQMERSRIQIIAVILNVFLNLILIPLISWKGAVIASIISEFSIFLFVTIFIIKKRNR
ncbi:hypothetical protein CFK37_08965 [Virgibacillus phasianinus]|uniref:Uncharacterized protein n=1 Tax=Virgibacillus phasianinus TaxID=2017483 RepID=A0A220U384_9BACI|nr:oligosaccharide flippase family protein [Virgibacillus phasianinus]ASK62281.1 hypothetical protein CFK37_08965 [Virgibacillus phasianinus]